MNRPSTKIQEPQQVTTHAPPLSENSADAESVLLCTIKSAPILNPPIPMHHEWSPSPVAHSPKREAAG